MKTNVMSKIDLERMKTAMLCFGTLGVQAKKTRNNIVIVSSRVFHRNGTRRWKSVEDHGGNNFWIRSFVDANGDKYRNSNSTRNFIYARDPENSSATFAASVFDVERSADRNKRIDHLAVMHAMSVFLFFFLSLLPWRSHNAAMYHFSATREAEANARGLRSLPRARRDLLRYAGSDLSAVTF